MLLATVVLTSVAWYIFTEDQPSAYQKEIHERYADFIRYQEPVKQSMAASQQTTSVSRTPSTGFPSAIGLDLHACTPGAAEIQYANGIVHFAFSGIERVESALTSNDCIFYVGVEKSDQTWDQTLNIKCDWIIASLSKYRYKDNVLLAVDANGVQFGNFLNNCQDLQTGRRPMQL